MNQNQSCLSLFMRPLKRTDVEQRLAEKIATKIEELCTGNSEMSEGHQKLSFCKRYNSVYCRKLPEARNFLQNRAK